MPELKINNVKKDVLVATLQKEGYATFDPPAKKKSTADDDNDDDDEAMDVEATGGGGKRSYDLNVVTVGNDEARWKFLLELVQDRLEG